jgi:3-isopropylmalate/(R)-2-methylmalate dehydratase small subunit
VTLPGGGTAKFPIESFSRYCLMNGVDELGFLLSKADAITAFESKV